MKNLIYRASPWITAITFAGTLLTSPVASSAAIATPLEPIEFTLSQSNTAKEIIKKLEKRHYINQTLTDNLSSRLLDEYLERLDGSKAFFLQSDLNEFEKYRLTLDDSLKKGNLAPGYEIFNRYQKRLIDRLENTIDSLEKVISSLDFKRSENLTLDRSELDWPKNKTQADDLWRKRIKNQVISFRLAKKEEKEILTLMRKRFTNQLNRIKQSNSEDAFQIYMNALTSLYDPHTNYLSPNNSENFNINMSLSLEGIGAVLQTEDEYTKVVRLVPAGPADKQGELEPSDRIVGVAEGEGDIVDVIGLRLDEVVKLIRGKKDSVVRLEVIPVAAKTDAETKIINITRNTVKLEEQSAQKKVLEILIDGELTKIGVIDIPAFYIDFDAQRNGDPNYTSTTRDVSKLLSELISEGVEGIIIDLRENGGGSLQEANQLTGLFIKSGPTVQIRHSSTQVYRDGKRVVSRYYQGPLAVLVNRLSASASEIFAGAIQDYHRGIVVGSQSFGKGTVQSLTALKQGQLKITESKFYRISGESTQHRGVIPDIIFPGLYDKEKVGESSLDNALAWDTINAVPHQYYFDIPSILPSLKKKHQTRIKNDPDFIFLAEQYALIEESRAIKTLPLNEIERKAFLDKEKQRRLAIENKRRTKKGLELLTSFDDEEDQVSGDKLAAHPSKDDDEDEKEEEAIDPLLNEAGQILVDAMAIYYPNRVAARESLKTQGKDTAENM